jgi:hypothetical protein
VTISPNHDNHDDPYVDLVYVLEPDVEAISEPDDESGGRTRSRLYRRAVALLMVLVLLAGAIFAAIRPWLLDRSSPSFDAVLTGVAVAAGDCANVAPLGQGETFTPVYGLCVCGRLYPYKAEVNYRVELRTTGGARLGRWLYHDQRRGPFCHLVRLEPPLLEGRYILELFAEHTRQPTARLYFSIQAVQRAV